MNGSRFLRQGAGPVLALIAAGVAATLSAMPGAGDQAELLLQSGIHKELVDGELEAAIDLYETIVASHGDNRPVAAQALLRMGECYEKLGQEGARKAYERLLRDYADQKDVVERARVRLAVLRRPEGEPGMVTRRVWAGPKTDFYGQVSPDGRYLSFVDWDTGDLAIRDLEKGTNRRLTDKGPWEKSSEEAELSIWSPDGRQLAYDWVSDHVELRVIGLDEATARVVYSGTKSGDWIQPCDWSPDGTHILAILAEDTALPRIVLLSVADGAVRVLKVLPRDVGVARARFSTDGRYVIYDLPQADGSSAHDIHLLPVEGGAESPLVEHPADDLLLGCGPKGEWVVFASDRSGTLDVWAIRLRDGKPQGPPVRVKTAVGRIWPMGFTRNGSFYYGLPRAGSDIFVVKLDPDTGALLAPPKKVVKQFEGSNHAPRYSPDGNSLAYLSTRMNAVFPLGVGWGDTLCVRSLETGEDREFRRELVRAGLTAISRPRWSPDGTSILLFGRDSEGLHGIYHFDLESGVARRVVREEEDLRVESSGGWRDQRSFLYRRIDKKSGAGAICVKDLEGGAETVIHSFESFGPEREFAVSPDGRLLSTALRQKSKEIVLFVMSTDGESLRELGRFNKDAWPGFLEWSADGTHLLFIQRIGLPADERFKFEVWRMPLEGGPPQRTGLEMPGVIAHMSVHPDGQHLAFEFRPAQALAEIWTIENFLPPRGASN